ncbi:hypothetical protein WG947_11735 [Pontibacter sp. H259]|uniref:hypothetical protein n=1 Tax=Pontibacter sp. H259 TaxID=3133421 RepID=UPI0030BE4DDE
MKFWPKPFAILFLIFSVLLVACSDESPSPAREYHQLETQGVQAVSAASATFIANILTSGKEPILQHGFTWGRTRPFADKPGFGTKYLGSRTGTGTFATTVEYAFTKKSVYYVRPFVKTANTIVYGNMVAFTPNP